MDTNLIDVTDLSDQAIDALLEAGAAGKSVDEALADAGISRTSTPASEKTVMSLPTIQMTGRVSYRHRTRDFLFIRVEVEAQGIHNFPVRCCEPLASEVEKWISVRQLISIEGHLENQGIADGPIYLHEDLVLFADRVDLLAGSSGQEVSGLDPELWE